MRLEVLVGSEAPSVYPINSSKVLIGSGENCDIILSADGVSRKHLVVVVEDDNYFVMDQGSTNGTYINEERLVPGRKVEFTSFFPVRLGDNVLISLLSDEENLNYSTPVANEPKEEPTKVIKLNELKKVKTENLIIERNKKREILKKASKTEVRSAPPTKPKDYKLVFIGLFCIAIVGVAAYFNIYVMKPKVVEQPAVVEVPKKPEKVVPADPNLIPKDELPTREAFLETRANYKCSIDTELYLCGLIPGAKGENMGATQTGLSINVFIDGTPYYEEAKKYIDNPLQNEESIKAYNELLRQTVAYIYLMKHLPVLDAVFLADMKIFIGFMKTVDGKETLDMIIGFRPDVVNREKAGLKEEQLMYIRTSGAAVLETPKKFYTII